MTDYFNHSRREIYPLLPASFSSVLEIGCGSGNTLLWLKELKRCEWVGGVEISKAASDEARNRLNALYEGNIESIILPLEENSLDLILCLDVLEHLIDPWAAVHRFKKLLKVGGALIASIPNVRNHNVLFPLLFKGQWNYTAAGFLDKSHLRFFVRETAIQLIESSGLHVDRITSTGLGRSRKSKVINSLLPVFITSLFEKQYLIRGIRTE